MQHIEKYEFRLCFFKFNKLLTYEMTVKTVCPSKVDMLHVFVHLSEHRVFSSAFPVTASHTKSLRLSALEMPLTPLDGTVAQHENNRQPTQEIAQRVRISAP